MRPVERQRKTARASAKPKRGPARSPRAAAPRENFGRRKKRGPGAIARLWQAFAEKRALRRPMLMMTGAFVALAFITALFVGGYVGRTIHAAKSGLDTIVSDAGFGISSVHLSGNHRTPPRMVLAALGFSLDQSIFTADLQSARARLMALAWVSDAEVSRTYPDSISVSLVEKLPFALWESHARALCGRAFRRTHRARECCAIPASAAFHRRCAEGWCGSRRCDFRASRGGRVCARHAACVGAAVESAAR